MELANTDIFAAETLERVEGIQLASRASETVVSDLKPFCSDLSVLLLHHINSVMKHKTKYAEKSAATTIIVQPEPESPLWTKNTPCRQLIRKPLKKYGDRNKTFVKHFRS